MGVTGTKPLKFDEGLAMQLTFEYRPERPGVVQPLRVVIIREKGPVIVNDPEASSDIRRRR